MSRLSVYRPCRFSPLTTYTHIGVPASVQVTCRYKCSQPISTKNSNNRLRQTTTYEKSKWSADYIESLQSDYKGWTCSKQIKKLKEVVKDMIVDDTMASAAKLQLIGKLERLGVGYHFEKEIKTALDMLSLSKDPCTGDDLYSTALYFRLLRQHGYKVSQEVFNCFLNDETESFRLDLCEDIKGILSLYEASHLCLEGEDILHVARDFAVKHLMHLNENIDPGLAKEVEHALELPLHRRMQRLEARYYIEAYQREDNMNPTLLEFAKLDFNMLQATYQQELHTISRWWKHLGLSDKLNFARDRLVESFVWSIGVAYKPQYQSCREWITKAVCFILIIDDIYDIYGSFDELQLLTAAVERWDLKAMEQLPDYMKICVSALFNTMNDMVYLKYKDQSFHILPHVKKAWVDFCKAMLVEAKWSRMGYTPSLEEYLENAWVSSSITVCLVLAFFGRNQTVTNDDVSESLNEKPDLIYYSSMLVRLWNDLATSSAELERGDVPSAIQCYIHETNTSEHNARAKIRNQLSETWKKLNNSTYDSPFDGSFINIVVNNARTANAIYQHGDGFGVQDHEAKERVVQLLVRPISIRNNIFLYD